MEENLGLLLELVGILGCQVADGVVLGTFLLDGRVALEVTLQTLRHIFALWDDADAVGQVLQDFRHQQRVVRAAKDDGVNLRVEMHQLVDALLHEIVGTGGVGLVVLYQRHPERTGDTADDDVREQLLDFHVVALALDGTLSSQDAYMAALGQRTYHLGRRADDAKDAAVGIPSWQVVLLDGAQGLGRRRVTAEDDQMAPLLEESLHGLARKLIDDIEGTRTVRRTGIVAEVQVVVLGKQLADAVQDGQSAIAAVEDADRPRLT